MVSTKKNASNSILLERFNNYKNGGKYRLKKAIVGCCKNGGASRYLKDSLLILYDGP